MVEADVDANSSLKKRKLSTQVIEIARKNEATAVKWHSARNSCGIETSSTNFRWWKAWCYRSLRTSEVTRWWSLQQKAQDRISRPTANVALTPWLLQQYQLSQPTDVNLPQGLIERKDAKYRWASYSRIAPHLHSHTRSPQGQMIAPPFGIQLIDSFRKWQALQIPRK